MQYSASWWREKLQLQSHVEGGAFRETYRSEWMLDMSTLPAGITGNRNASTCIYFLLEYGEFSAFHRIAADEIWHFYDGHSLTIYEIEPGGNLITHQLGKDFEKGERLQVIITAGNWFASRTEVPGGYALTGCTVAPGFDFADFELAERAPLQAAYPQHEALIASLTR
ncbi:cupin domain-containing protein [Chitinophaga sp. sic0106]|uniref:cupin domain-containing protein n=1 Tax=Chitinophaga sp. sic0106 TaxID=2854785 RepID=UPI001C4884A5|nr:cupin domain-containing protein [Chitinophaga sp. sic0106]MBV7532228.1 cupin domain-containing protein [Chitinophaga sp. sic0106]